MYQNPEAHKVTKAKAEIAQEQIVDLRSKYYAMPSKTWAERFKREAVVIKIMALTKEK